METTLHSNKVSENKGIEHRAFEEFVVIYKPVLVRVEEYLEEIIKKTDPTYAVGYVPWKNALHELITGAYLIARKIPIPNKDDFMEALCLFSFESAIKFLRDICNICQLQLKRNWEKEFREHINRLLFAFSALHMQQQNSQSR